MIIFSMSREKGINVIIYDEMVCAGYFQGGKVRIYSKSNTSQKKISLDHKMWSESDLMVW